MEIETVFGAKWKLPTIYDFLLIFGIIIIVIGILIIFKYNIKGKEKKSHLFQLLLFKARQLDLTNYQIKILNSIASSLKIKNPNILFSNPALFETSILKFLSFLSTQNEKQESLTYIVKDLVMIYQKIYYPAKFKKPMEFIEDIEENQLLYFITEKNDIFPGKLISIDKNNITINLLIDTSLINKILIDMDITVYFWRIGDAEYFFKSHIIDIKQNIIQIAIPDTFTRGKEARHPSIDVDIPCVITFNPHKKQPEGDQQDEAEIQEEQILTDELVYDEVEGLLFKLNIDEASVRIGQKLSYRESYFLNFDLMDFKMKIVTTIISERTIEKNELYYYTFKFKEMTKASEEVLHKYLIEYQK